jgi:hypothetical protein
MELKLGQNTHSIPPVNTRVAYYNQAVDMAERKKSQYCLDVVYLAERLVELVPGRSVVSSDLQGVCDHVSVGDHDTFLCPY